MAPTRRLLPIWLLMMMLVIVKMRVEAAEIGNLKFIGLQTSGVYRRLFQVLDCKAACQERCKAASMKDRCLRACGTCCVRCNCVPPGTYGNKELCPCYANMKTHGNRPKCP